MDTIKVTVTIKMTQTQRDEYRAEYGDDNVADDVAGRLQADVTQALQSCNWMRGFATYSVSKPR